jgi:quercetin dioxygenase-like cupin family protein
MRSTCDLATLVIVSAAVTIAAALPAIRASDVLPQTEQVVPVHQEPRHRLVFDSPGTRVLDVQIPPGDTTLFHTHSDPILYVTMSTSRTRSQILGADWSAPGASESRGAGRGSGSASPEVVPSTPPGRLMSTTSYAERPLTHRVNNIGASLFRLIGITNSSAGDSSEGASNGFSQPPEITNRWFRGYRHSLEERPDFEHRHANPVVIVVVTGSAQVHATGAGSPRALASPGAFTFVDGNTAHRLQGSSPGSQVVEVEIRRPGSLRMEDGRPDAARLR